MSFGAQSSSSSTPIDLGPTPAAGDEAVNLLSLAQGRATAASKLQTERALQDIEFLFNQSRSDLTPSRVGSFQALDQLSDLLGVARPTEGSVNLAQSFLDRAEAQQEFDAANIPVDASEIMSAVNLPRDPIRANQLEIAIRNIKDVRPDFTGEDEQKIRDIINVRPDVVEEFTAKNPDISELDLVRSDTDQRREAINIMLDTFLDERFSVDPSQRPENLDLTDFDFAVQGPEEQLRLIEENPGFQFRLGRGLDSIAAQNAAKGLLSSGRTLKELQSFGEGLAADEFNAQAGRLAQLAGLTFAGTQAGVQAGGQSSGIGSGVQQGLINLLSQNAMQGWDGPGGSHLSF